MTNDSSSQFSRSQSRVVLGSKSNSRTGNIRNDQMPKRTPYVAVFLEIEGERYPPTTLRRSVPDIRNDGLFVFSHLSFTLVNM